MKIIIAHSKTKREICGAFDLCGSRENLKRVADAINDEISESKFDYGWVTIPDKCERLPNTEPIRWDK